jgi:hypothetical protein
VFRRRGELCSLQLTDAGVQLTAGSRHDFLRIRPAARLAVETPPREELASPARVRLGRGT